MSVGHRYYIKCVNRNKANCKNDIKINLPQFLYKVFTKIEAAPKSVKEKYRNGVLRFFIWSPQSCVSLLRVWGFFTYAFRGGKGALFLLRHFISLIKSHQLQLLLKFIASWANDDFY